MFECIIIGAGPCGIVATKELLEQGIENVLCLEQSDEMGGTFSTSYESLRLTTSTTFSMFSDFWIGNDQNDKFWSKKEAVNYWENYAQQFDVLPLIKFNCKVVKIEEEGDDFLIDDTIWKVRLASGEIIKSRRIVLAVGNNRLPKFPKWKDYLKKISYTHSISYKNAERYAGKDVLVIGGGESGSDIALEISRVASNCWISLRNSTGWVVPRKRGPVASDNSTHRGIWNLPVQHGVPLSKRLIRRELSKNDPVHDAVVELNKLVRTKYGIRGAYGTKSFALPQAIARHNCKLVKEVTHVLEGDKLLTEDGGLLEDIDEIVFCTGYKNQLDFLPEKYQKIDPRDLYKHLIHPELTDRMVWMGLARPGFGSQFPIMEMQARLFALVVSNQHKLPSKIELEKTAALDKVQYLERFQENAQNIRSLVDYHHYMDDVAKIIGCHPPIIKYFFLKPALWFRIVFGPTQATQFRLRGPGSKKQIAQEIIKKLPTIKFNLIIQQGLKGRFMFCWPWIKCKAKAFLARR